MSSQEDQELSMEEQLEEAMKLLQQPIDQADIQQSQDTTTIPTGQEQSPTLAILDHARRPKIKTACEACPNSLWFSSPEEVKCFCRIMHMISWSAKEPNLITQCDGQFLV